MTHIVLASASPRRQELLRHMGIRDFTVRVSQAEETYPPDLSPEEIVCHLSQLKAAAVDASPEEIVIAADTMVFLDGRPLGKPHDEDEALCMLTSLQGRSHTVSTGVTVRRGADIRTEAETTAVTFRPAAEAELKAYIRTGEPMDKAGAYGIQGLGALLVEGIRGDYYNVVGLPILRLSRMLAPFGVTFFDQAKERTI